MKCLIVVSIIFYSNFLAGEETVSMKSREQIMKTFFYNRPVLVTGGAGFIGSHLVEKLVELGAYVTVLDDFSTGSLENLASVSDAITIQRASITDRAACLQATKGASVVFHLAAFISVPDSLHNPLQCYEINVQGTLNLLEACRINNVTRFVFSSSAAVYGSGHELCAEDSATTPESAYGTSKLIGEFLCQQYARNFGLKTICLRYFNVFGDRQNPQGSYAGVVAKFKDQMRNNYPITIFGNGQQTRDFIPVGNVVAANLNLALLADGEMTGQAYNIATGTSITLLELVELLKKDFPTYQEPVRFLPARAGDIQRSAANCQKYYRVIERDYSAVF
jgi:UDP-N-acetylglucosamine/UDP-N-acetyl-alpha-D-glucosaminouronate 4-epimerase